jgi:fatty acid CoA ligase FadD36
VKGSTVVLLPALTGTMVDRPDAVVVGQDLMSWEQLRAAAMATANRIAGATTVAVRAAPTLETVVAVVAGLLAGVPVAPLPPDSGPLERDHIIADCGAELLLGTGTAAVPVVPVALTGTASMRYPEPPEGSIALILYTSGTSGPSKGVLISRGAIAADLDALADAWEWTAQDRLVHGLPLYHVHGLVLGVLGALRTGSRLQHTVRPSVPAYARAQGTLYFGVPTVWSRICAQPSAARALADARLLVSGSAPLPQPVSDRLFALTGHRLVQRYGMTETLITLSARAGGPHWPGCVGTVVAGVRTRLADDDGHAAPHDGESIGELQVRGPSLFAGYLNRPDATVAAYTADGWFRTGDAATITADGVHRIVGRTSVDLIKCGGYRVGAGEVEDALLSHPGVREAAVVGVPHADLGQEIVAYVVADNASADQLIEHVAVHLSRHKRPRRVHLVESLPRNALGKVLKGQLTSGTPKGSLGLHDDVPQRSTR